MPIMTKPMQRHWKQGPDPEWNDSFQALPRVLWTKHEDRLQLSSIPINESVRCIGWSGKQIRAAIAATIYYHAKRWPQLPTPNWSYWRHAPTQSWVITRTH